MGVFSCLLFEVERAVVEGLAVVGHGRFVPRRSQLHAGFAPFRVFLPDLVSTTGTATAGCATKLDDLVPVISIQTRDRADFEHVEFGRELNVFGLAG